LQFRGEKSCDLHAALLTQPRLKFLNYKERVILFMKGTIDLYAQFQKHKRFDDVYRELYQHAQLQPSFDDHGPADFLDECKRLQERGLKWGWLAKAGEHRQRKLGIRLTLSSWNTDSSHLGRSALSHSAQSHKAHRIQGCGSHAARPIFVPQVRNSTCSSLRAILPAVFFALQTHQCEISWSPIRARSCRRRDVLELGAVLSVSFQNFNCRTHSSSDWFSQHVCTAAKKSYLELQ
jgi:hypothetical protein